MDERLQQRAGYSCAATDHKVAVSEASSVEMAAARIFECEAAATRWATHSGFKMEATDYDSEGSDYSFSPEGYEWEHAFAKYGFADGDGREFTPMVANKLADFGIKCDIVEWSLHNHAIAKMTTSDGRVIYDRCPSKIDAFVDDRIVTEAVENAFGEDWKKGIEVKRAMDKWWDALVRDSLYW